MSARGTVVQTRVNATASQMTVAVVMSAVAAGTAAAILMALLRWWKGLLPPPPQPIESAKMDSAELVAVVVHPDGAEAFVLTGGCECSSDACGGHGPGRGGGEGSR